MGCGLVSLVLLTLLFSFYLIGGNSIDIGYTVPPIPPRTLQVTETIYDSNGDTTFIIDVYLSATMGVRFESRAANSDTKWITLINQDGIYTWSDPLSTYNHIHSDTILDEAINERIEGYFAIPMEIASTDYGLFRLLGPTIEFLGEDVQGGDSVFHYRVRPNMFTPSTSPQRLEIWIYSTGRPAKILANVRNGKETWVAFPFIYDEPLADTFFVDSVRQVAHN